MSWWGSNLSQQLTLDLGSVHTLSYIFKPLNILDMHARDKQTKYRQWVQFFHSYQYNLIPKRYNYNDTRLLKQMAYRDEGGKIGGTWYALIRISLPRCLGWGTSLPTNKHLKNWLLTSSVRILYRLWTYHIITPFPKFLWISKAQVRTEDLTIYWYPKYQVKPLDHAGISYRWSFGCGCC